MRKLLERIQPLLPHALPTALAGLSLAAPASLIYAGGVPAPWAPLPAWLLTPALRGVPAWILPPLAFWALGFRLLRGEARIRFRACFLFSIAALWNLIWLCVALPRWEEMHVRAHAWIVLGANAAFCAALIHLLFLSERRPSFALGLAYHWLLFVWLGWYAFPYYGKAF